MYTSYMLLYFTCWHKYCLRSSDHSNELQQPAHAVLS